MRTGLLDSPLNRGWRTTEVRFLIVDQCSASKSVSDSDAVVDADRNERAPTEVIAERDAVGTPARDLYTGIQQRRISEAVRILRGNGHDVQRLFISAGFGLVEETDELPPYDATFSGQSDDVIRQRSDDLRITTDLEERVRTEDAFDIIFLPLGADYYAALNLDRVYASVPEEATVVVFNREEDEHRDHVLSLPARTDEAKTNGSAVIELKGTYLKQFATGLEKGRGPLGHGAIEALCLAQDGAQSNHSDHG